MAAEPRTIEFQLYWGLCASVPRASGAMPAFVPRFEFVNAADGASVGTVIKQARTARRLKPWAVP